MPWAQVSLDISQPDIGKVAVKELPTPPVLMANYLADLPKVRSKKKLEQKCPPLPAPRIGPETPRQMKSSQLQSINNYLFYMAKGDVVVRKASQSPDPFIAAPQSEQLYKTP